MPEITFGEHVVNHLNAGFAALWCHCCEQEEAAQEITREAFISETVREGRSERDFPMILQWDCAAGLRELAEDGNSWTPRLSGGNQPQPVLMPEALVAMLQSGGEPTKDGVPTPINGPFRKRCLVVLRNLELTLNPVRAQIIRNHLVLAEKDLKQRLVVLSDKAEPPEVMGQRTFSVLTQGLPTFEQLSRELDVILETGGEDDLAEGNTPESIVGAASGLTRVEARNQFSLCLVEDGAISAPRVFDRKRVAIEQKGLGLEILKGAVTFDQVGGFAWAKEYLTAMLRASAEFRGDRELKPRGVILAGVPGTGKSLMSLALGNSVTPRRPTVRWNPALTGSKYVSEGASNMKQVLDIFDRNAPMIIQVDEGEKQQQASYSGGDSAAAGQAAEMQALWLTWHEESSADCYPIFTMNQGVFDILATRPEFLARFDRVFFIDVPTREQKDQIWRIEAMRKRLIEHPEEWDDLVRKGDIPDDSGWVGRDIGRCCREAKLMGMPLSEVRLGTTSNQAKELLHKMRESAHGRFMSVDYNGFYEREGHERRVRESLTSTRDVVRKRKRT